MPIAIINMGGVRGEEQFFTDLDPSQQGDRAVRTGLSTDELLPQLVSELRQTIVDNSPISSTAGPLENSGVFKEMLS
jgi:hypothetical protein